MTPPRRPLVRRVATVLSGVLLLAAASAAALAGERWPVAEAELGALEVSVEASSLTLVCPGPPRLATAAAGEDLGYDEFDPEGSGTQSVTSALSAGRDGQAPGPLYLEEALTPPEGEGAALTGDVRLLQLSEVGRSARLEADPAGGELALAAGTSLAATLDGDLRGLSAAPCQVPATSAWLVGGSTQPGDSAQLVLANAGDTAATVTLHGWGSTGPLDLSAAGNVLVPPRGEQVVLLEALATDPRPALQVVATGGEVTAVVQDSRLRGLVPAGTDLVTAGAAPAEEVVIPGIVLGDASGEEADAPAVRVVNPGEDQTTVTLELLGGDGVEPVPGADAVVVDAGAVMEISLAGLPAGTWSARLRADAPVTGAAVLTSVGETAEGTQVPPVDRTWVAATEGLASGLTASPQAEGLDTSAVVVLANPADSPLAVELVAILADGTRAAAVEHSVAAATTLAVGAAGLAGEAPVGVEVRADDGVVHAAVLVSAQAPDGLLISTMPVTEDAHTARAVSLAPSVRSLR